MEDSRAVVAAFYGGDDDDDGKISSSITHSIVVYKISRGVCKMIIMTEMV